VGTPRPFAQCILRLSVIVALLAVVFGRSLAAALPGSRSGLYKILGISALLGGFFTQLLAVLIVVLCTRLAFITWQESRLSNAYRFFSAPSACTVIVIVTAASFDFVVGPSTPEISLLLGIAGTLVAVYASGVILMPSRLRASGIVLAFVAAASVAQVSARLIALQASEAALRTQYDVARGLASLATFLDALALAVTAVWLGLRWTKVGRTLLLGTLGLAVTVGELAQRGSRVQSGFAEVLLSRSLAQLHREPSSYFPRVVQDTQELLALLLAVILLSRPRNVSPQQRLCLALVLLARSSPDIPLCSGLLVTGALGLSLLAADLTEPRGNQAVQSAAA